MKRFKLGKIAVCIASAVAMTFAVSAASACNIETAHPEAEITYSFNGKTYAVKYTLYRNMYPHTVRHFIELANNGFYDNTVVHSYTTNDWFTGGYSYDADDYSAKMSSGSQMSEYFDGQSKEDAYVQLFNEGKLSRSVYANLNYSGEDQTVNKDSALYTVMGEFYNNIHQTIEKGKLTAEYGCLKMYYYEKETTKKVIVTPTEDQPTLADYKYNSATSVYAVQVGTSSSYNENNYTVFARLSSTDTFDSFVTAIRNYISDNHGGTTSEFYTETSVRVDNNENFSDKLEADKGTTVTFNAPKTPVVIESVKITKY